MSVTLYIGLGLTFSFFNMACTGRHEILTEILQKCQEQIAHTSFLGEISTAKEVALPQKQLF